MNKEDLTDLIYAYDALRTLKTVLGVGDIGFGHGDGVLGALERIEEVISRNTPIIDPDERFDILDSTLPANEKAEKLLKKVWVVDPED